MLWVTTGRVLQRDIRLLGHVLHCELDRWANVRKMPTVPNVPTGIQHGPRRIYLRTLPGKLVGSGRHVLLCVPRHCARVWRSGLPQDTKLHEQQRSGQVKVGTCHGEADHLIAYAGNHAVHAAQCAVALCDSNDDDHVQLHVKSVEPPVSLELPFSRGRVSRAKTSQVSLRHNTVCHDVPYRVYGVHLVILACACATATLQVPVLR